MKNRLLPLTILFTLLLAFPAQADIISDLPGEPQGDEVTLASQPGPQGAVSSDQSAGAAAEVNVPAPVSAGPGSYMVQLGFSVVSPNRTADGRRLAKGSVQLANGSWQDLTGLNCPYYRLLREQTDSTGILWYVVKCSARRFSNTDTSDGSKASELWMLKSDCTRAESVGITTSSDTRAAIVKAALEKLGMPYSYGGSGPDAFDCSGFVQYVMKQAGVQVPRTSSEICSMSGAVPLTSLRPGDICGRNGHVGIYVGDGVFVHASESDIGVIAEQLSSYNQYNPFTVYINAVGD